MRHTRRQGARPLPPYKLRTTDLGEIDPGAPTEVRRPHGERPGALSSPPPLLPAVGRCVEISPPRVILWTLPERADETHLRPVALVFGGVRHGPRGPARGGGAGEVRRALAAGRG